MVTSNVYSFDNWKEFSLEKPNEVFYNSLQNVLENTDLEGNLKHKKENVYKVFSLLITHNYGYILYELIHLLHYLNTIKIPCYKVLVLKTYNLQKEILADKNIVNKEKKDIECSINKKEFRISFSRIPVLLVLLDFIEEFLGVKKIIEFGDYLEKIEDNNQLTSISNNLSKLLYEFMKDKLPSAHIQNHGYLISEELSRFRNKKFDDLNPDDIDDKFIFDLWERVNTVYENISLKTYRLVFQLCLKFKKAMELSPSLTLSSRVTENNESVWYQEKFYGDSNEDSYQWDISSKKFETIANHIVEDNEKLEDGINFFEVLQKKGINLIKKNEIEELKLLNFYPEFLNKMPLSYIRNIIFTNLQNILIEGERRNKFRESLSKILKAKNKSYYQDYLNKNEKTSTHLIKLKSIIFSYLWDNKSKFSAELINDYLSCNEKDALREFSKEYINQNPGNVDGLVLNIKNFIQDEHKNGKKFSEVQFKIIQFNAFRKSFRRKGLFEDEISDLNKTFYEASKFINKFIVTIINFKESLSDTKDLNSQFRRDFEEFTRIFSLIHGAK
ncbi:hypothetical protein OBA40_03635 [Alphaproteobacteria bacterium]|nr:hypothetical protein [Alphaproteobacteria bacterium]